MSKAVRQAAKDSEITSVLLSGVTTMPLGKASSLATSRASPSGVTSAILPGALPLPSTSLNSLKSKLIVFT